MSVNITPQSETSKHLDDEEVIYDITSFGADFLVDGLIRRLDDGDIFKPTFQRNFVWSLPQASKFIESILLGLPIPGIFLYREESTKKHLIIDGLQRLTTIQAYENGFLPDSNRRFSLKGVKARFEGKSLEELEITDQRRFRDAAIHATIIQQNYPREDNSAVFHIFERLNTGGTPLQAQEMRAAVFHGEFQDMLESLNKHPSWREIFGRVNKRAKDQELILRFLAMYFNIQNYAEPMKKFLNDFMSENRNAGRLKLQTFEKLFTDTCDKAVTILGDKPFRPSRALNVAVFDSCMIALAKSDKKTAAEIMYGYQNLLRNENYLSAVSKSTASEANVNLRLRLAMEFLV